MPPLLVTPALRDFGVSWVLSNNNNAYVAGELGLFYYSSDKGETWTTFETGYNGSLWSSLLIADNELILMGMSGNIITAKLIS